MSDSGRLGVVPPDMRWLLLVTLFMVSVYVTLPAAGEEEMTCQLAEDIAAAAEIRSIYLEGVRDRVTGIEEMTLTAELEGLWSLRSRMSHWRLENCK